MSTIQRPESPARGVWSSSVILRAMRPHHWLKNTLVFVPVMLSHMFDDPPTVMAALLAFCSLCCAASATYLLNDMRDIESDRKHPTKRFRPLASGELAIGTARAMVPLLLAAAVAFALLVPNPGWMLAALGAYLVTSFAYVRVLKRKLLVDVLALAVLHTLRIMAGNAATGIAMSSWLLAFAMLVFFSLALVKRYAELRDSTESEGLRGRGRGYQVEDLEILSQLGVSSALMSVVLLALYVDSQSVKVLYSQPKLIWLICPIVLYVLSRVWVLARRGQLDDDPLVFIMRDWRSQLMGVVTVGVMVAAWLL